MSRQLNLYDARFLPQQDWLSAHNLLLGALLSVFVISVGTAFTRWSIASNEEQAKAISAQLANERAAFAILTGMLATRKADGALQQEVIDLEQGVMSAQGALTLLRGMTANQSTPVVGEMMRAFSRVATDGLWLTGFVVLEGGQQLEIRGRMLDQALLPPYLKRLEAESVFHGRRFSALDMKGGEWVPPSAAGVAPEVSKVNAGPAGRWYVDFVLRTRRDDKENPGGAASAFDTVKR